MKFVLLLLTLAFSAACSTPGSEPKTSTAKGTMNGLVESFRANDELAYSSYVDEARMGRKKAEGFYLLGSTTFDPERDYQMSVDKVREVNDVADGYLRVSSKNENEEVLMRLRLERTGNTWTVVDVDLDNGLQGPYGTVKAP